MVQLLDRLRQLEHTAPTDLTLRQIVKPTDGRATRDLNAPLNPRITPANITDLHPVRTMEGHQGYVHAVCFSPDASIVATGSGLTGKNNLLGREKSENVLNLWSVASGELLGRLSGAQREIRTIAFSSDGRLVAATGRNVKLWDVYTQKLIGSLGGHHPYVRGMALSSAAGLIASSSATHSAIHLWDITKRQSIATLENNEWVNCLAFSPDGTLLAVGSLSRTISIYEVASQRRVMRLDHHANRMQMSLSGVHVLAFSPDGGMLASVADDGGISFWEMAHFRRLGHLGGFESDISALSFSPDSQLIACAAGNTLHICDPSREISRLVEHTSPIDDVAWSSTGGLLATVSRDKTIKMWGIQPA
ncbi:MAG: WD40 repeat domain-containing protein [Anaerolineae bacterium]|nr:MAG: WD40 repeat domain-containing protein [Anaerolineae bacterium]